MHKFAAHVEQFSADWRSKLGDNNLDYSFDTENK